MRSGQFQPCYLGFSSSEKSTRLTKKHKGMPLNVLSVGAGGGCGVGLGLGWGFGTAFGSHYRSARVTFQGIELETMENMSTST